MYMRFKKANQKTKKNNGGFSLIEVLVAIVILAIIAATILSVFASSAKINNKARQQENANTVAQLMTERLKGLNIDAIVSALDGPESSSHPYGLDSYTKTVSDKTGETVYVFNTTALDLNGNPYVDGTSVGDKFYASIELNPDDYSDKENPSDAVGDKEKNNINSDMPSFNDVLSDDNCVVLRQISQHDIDAENAFKSKGETLRSRNVSIEEQIKEDLGNVFQNIKMIITYNGSGSSTKVYEYDLENFDVTADTTNPKNFYLFYKPYSNEDKVSFKVDSAISAASFDKNINLYLIKQDNSSVTDFKWNNVSFTPDSQANIIKQNPDRTTGLGIKRNINFYSNVDGIQTGGSNSITHNSAENSEVRYLYNMQIKIWVNQTVPSDKSNPYLTITSTKDN